MRHILERLLRSVDPPDPERAARLWADYRANRTGADVAFATLLAWYGGPIYRRIWGFVRSDAAEDVFQDLLIRLHRRRHRFTDFEHALRWLRGVAVTQSLNARRGDVRRAARERTRAVANGTTGGVEAAELVAALRVALAKLPDREREAVALVYFEGMTRQDAAAALGVHRDTVAKLLDVALGRLKSALAATAVAAAVTTAGVETALAANPGLPVARLSVLAEAARINARGAGFAWVPARRLVPLILAGGLVVVAVVATYTWSRFMARTPASSVRLQVDRLEPRDVLSTDFASAVGLASDSGRSRVEDVAVDSTGNTYLTGGFSGTVDFDPANDRLGGADVLTSAGGSDAFVAKYAPDGTLAWVTRMGGATPETVFTDAGWAVHVDAGGNVYVAGQFCGTADFGPLALTSNGTGKDGFVAKLGPTGGVQWAQRWGLADNDPATGRGDMGGGVGTDAAGNVYVSGTRQMTGATAASFGHDILKFSPTGAPVWTRFVNTKALGTSRLAVDAGGAMYLAGQFAGTVDFDPGPRTRTASSGPSQGGFVLKLTAAGNFDWVAPFVGQGSGKTAGSAVAQSLTLDGGGDVIVGGYYGNAVDFDPGSGTTTLPTGGGGFITKLTAGGSLAWARALEGTDSTFVYGVAVDAAGGIYATGAFKGTVDLDPGAGTRSRTTAGNFDVFAVKLTAAGEFTRAEMFGGPGEDLGRGIAVDAAGTVYLVGSYTGAVDFDPDPADTFYLPDTGFTNGFLVRLRQR